MALQFFSECQIVDVLEKNRTRLGIDHAEDVLVDEIALAAFDGLGFVVLELSGELSAGLTGDVGLAGVRAPVVTPVLFVFFRNVARVKPGIFLGVLSDLRFATREQPLGNVVDVFGVPGEPVEYFTSFH